MAYYYVKNGGTAVGDAGRYASQQAGSFATLGAAGYYNDIVAAIAATTSPVANDFINVSDLHSFSSGSAITYTGQSVTPFFIVSVDDSDVAAGRTSMNTPLEHAQGGSADISVGNCFISGVSLLSNDNIIFNGSSSLYDCSMTVNGSSDVCCQISGDGSSLALINTVMNGDNTNSIPIIINGGASISMVGGAVRTLSVGLNVLTSGGFASGGGFIDMRGVDLSGVTGVLVSDVGNNQSSDDVIQVRFDMCKLAAGVSFTNEIFKSSNQRLLATRCSDNSASAEYQYHLHTFGGDVDDDSVVFRNEDQPFTESNQKISYKIVTNSDVSLGSPLWLDFPVLRYSKLSTAAADTLRFYITSNTVLTNKDIYIEATYPDETNKQTPNFISSAPVTVGGTLDLMSAGTTLTTDTSSSWTGALSNLYQIDVDTSGDAGSDCQPIVKVYVTKPSITIQIASEFGLN